MRRPLSFVFALILSSLAAAQSPPGAPAAPNEPLRTAADRPFDIKHIRLELRVDLDKQEVAAAAAIDVRALRPVRSLSFDAVDLDVSGVQRQTDLGGFPVPFTNDGKRLHIDLPENLPADRDTRLLVAYRVRKPKAGLHFFKPTAAEPDVPVTVWSQGEAVTNRYWFPCADHPNQRQTTELVVTVPAGYEVLSNGKLVERTDNAADKTTVFHWKQDKPHVAYLVTLVVGKFAVITKEWRGKPVTFYVPPERKADAERSFGRTLEMLDFFSARFGIEYPWDKYAQVVVEQFSAGGMENTSATTLVDRALHDERAFLDSSPDGLIAHELAHQWWGDLVTCKDWAHIWLNEGFASYSEVLWAEHKEGADEGALNLLNKMKAAIGGGKERPVVDRRWSGPQMMFDARAYPKGAWVLHMLRRQLGDEAFFRCLKRWGTEYALRTAETSDFRKTLEAETGRSLERFFHDFTERPGCPVVEVGTEYLAESKLVRVTIKQTQAGEAFHFPLRMEFVPKDGKPVVLEETVTEKEVKFHVPMAGRPVRVRLDPGQTVLADWSESKGRDLWAAQLADDPSPVLRIAAAKWFGKSKSPADREALAKALAAEPFWGAAAEIAGALAESGGDVCRDALLAGLKHAHPKVRRACAAGLGKFRGDAKAAEALRGLLAGGDASYFVEAAAAEAYGKLRPADAASVLKPLLARPSHGEVIRSAALAGLAETGDPAVLDALAEWTKRGNPPTARAAALKGLDRLVALANPGDDIRAKAVRAAAACLDGERRPVLVAAVEALRGLGKSSAPALPALEALALHEPNDFLRDAAAKAIERIRSETPANLELTRLREEIDRLRKSNDSLLDRLDRVEKIERR